ncbi:MAG TPA: VWA domain-containing protein [Candidatus Angelobacter sp.]|jgi:VWFA-related protein|nr:VWA domain-containing protein [Candidatus Angelobacter sp.]
MWKMKIPAMLLILVLLAGIAGAQQPAPTPPPATKLADGNGSSDDQAIQTFRTHVDEVNLFFTVTDKHGRFVKDLQQDQFDILDNTKPPLKVLGFEAQTNLPLRVGLLIDASNSIRDKFHFEQQAAIEFLNQIIRPQSDKAFVLAFDEVPDLQQDFTNDIGKLTKGINNIRPGGGTAMWDAVYYACRDKLMKEQATGPVRRAIILVSDGDDNQSRALRQEAIEMAQRSGVIIYAISTNLSNIKDSGDKNLKILADATGGQAFYPFKLQDLSDAFTEIQGELRSQYFIAYKPDNFLANGQYRPISVLAKNKKLRVRAKKGYFAATQ